MNKTAQLVVHFDKKNTFLMLKLLPAMVAVMAVGLFYFSRIEYSSLNILLSSAIVVIKSILYVSIGLFLIGTLFAFSIVKYKGPAAILDQTGIWIKHYNFIPWKNIDEFTLYPVAEITDVIGIRVKDLLILSKQSDLSGKLGVFWAKLFGNYHITLANLDTPNEDIIIFARRYLNNHRDLQ